MAKTPREEDARGQIATLRAEVAKRKARERLRTDDAFAQALQSEKARSERHNHFFGLLCLQCFAAQTTKLLREAQRLFRCSDTVAAPSVEYLARFRNGGGAARPALLVILPETDREGVRTAWRRAQIALKFAPRSFGYAVYPDDGLTADELLRQALGGKK